jgi:hypothetical protein
LQQFRNWDERLHIASRAADMYGDVQSGRREFGVVLFVPEALSASWAPMREIPLRIVEPVL